MSYTKQTWATGDVITATKLNHIENGIENSKAYDAVILLTHADSSDYDSTTSLTPSIIEGSYEACAQKLDNNMIPTILITFKHLGYLYKWTCPITQISYYTTNVSVPFFAFFPYGPWNTSTNPNSNVERFSSSLYWDANNTIGWN